MPRSSGARLTHLRVLDPASASIITCCTNCFDLHFEIMRRLNPSYLHLFNSTYAFSSFLDLIENVYNGLFDICNSLASLKQEHSSLTISGIINYNSHLGAQIIIKNAKFGEHNSACSLFDSIRGDKPYSFLWNTMIRAYANGGCHVEVLELYPLMRPNNLIRWRS